MNNYKFILLIMVILNCLYAQETKFDSSLKELWQKITEQQKNSLQACQVFLSSKDDRVREKAIIILAKLIDQKIAANINKNTKREFVDKAISIMAKGLRDPSIRVKMISSQKLKEIGEVAVIELSQMLPNEEPQTQLWILQTIHRIVRRSYRAPKIEAKMLGITEEEKEKKRQRIFSQFTKVLTTTKDKDVQAAIAAIFVARVPKEAVAPLIKAYLQESDANFWVIFALGSTGKEAQSVIPQIIETFPKQNKGVQYITLKALTSIADVRALPLLMDVAKSDKRELRIEAIKAIASLGKNAKPALSLLTQSLQADNFAEQNESAKALAKMGDIAIPVLIRSLANPRITYRVTHLFGQMNITKVATEFIQIFKEDRAAQKIIIKNVNWQYISSVFLEILKMGDKDLFVELVPLSTSAIYNTRIEELINSVDPRMRIVAAYIYIDIENKENLLQGQRAFLEAIENNDTQLIAVRLLSPLKEKAIFAISTLEKLTQNKKNPNYQEIIKALKKIKTSKKIK